MSTNDRIDCAFETKMGIVKQTAILVNKLEHGQNKTDDHKRVRKGNVAGRCQTFTLLDGSHEENMGMEECQLFQLFGVGHDKNN